MADAIKALATSAIPFTFIFPLTDTDVDFKSIQVAPFRVELRHSSKILLLVDYFVLPRREAVCYWCVATSRVPYVYIAPLVILRLLVVSSIEHAQTSRAAHRSF